MYSVTKWNWGLYTERFDNLLDAELYYIQECQIADIMHNPRPTIKDSDGNQIRVYPEEIQNESS